MAVTLAQAEKNLTDSFQKSAYQIAVSISTVWDRLYFEGIQGNAYAYDKDKVLPGTAFRTVNEAYVEETGVVNSDVERLTILGGEVVVDRFIEQTYSDDIKIKIADQVAMKLESMSATFSDYFFNGDDVANPKGFNGLRKRLVGAQVMDSQVSVTDEGFLSELDELIDAANADAIYAPKAIRTPLKALFRKAGGYEYVISEITGKRELMWNGVPILEAGKTYDGRQILPFDVTAGGDMYAVKFARSDSDEGVLGIYNGGILTDPPKLMEDRPAYMARVEMYPGLVVQGGQAAARLRGVKK